MYSTTIVRSYTQTSVVVIIVLLLLLLMTRCTYIHATENCFVLHIIICTPVLVEK